MSLKGELYENCGDEHCRSAYWSGWPLPVFSEYLEFLRDQSSGRMNRVHPLTAYYEEDLNQSPLVLLSVSYPANCSARDQELMSCFPYL